MDRSIFCPYCKKHTEISQMGNGMSFRHGYAWIGRCNAEACQQVVLVVGANEKDIRRIFPSPLPCAVDSRIPGAIRRDFEEALLCESVGALRAAGAMARRAMQVCCIQNGAPHDPGKFNSIVTQIEWLVEQQIIPKQLSEWAHEIRLMGKDCAHPNRQEDEVDIATQEIREILELLEHLTDVLYVAPAKAKRRKQEREEKQKTPA